MSSRTIWVLCAFGGLACDSGDANACVRQGDLAYHRQLGLAKPNQQSVDTAQRKGKPRATFSFYSKAVTMLRLYEKVCFAGGRLLSTVRGRRSTRSPRNIAFRPSGWLVNIDRLKAS